MPLADHRPLIVLLLALTLAPGAPAQDELRSDLPRAQPALDRSALDRRARGTLDLGLEMLRAAPQGNAVLSPHALAQALALVLAGADGEAAVELRRALRITGKTEDGLAALNALDQVLTSRVGQGRSGAFTLRSAHALWARRDAPPSAAYLDALATHFGAGVRLVDLAGDPAGARAAIDQWATDALGEQLDDLVRAGEVTGDAGLVVVSAAALNAAWQSPFEINQSTQGRFTSQGAGSLVVPTMSATGLMRSITYEGVRAVEVPFARDELSLLVLVPEQGEVGALERSLTGDRLAGIMGAMGQQPVNTRLVLPRFAVRTRLDLRDGLRAAGLRAALASGALAAFVHEARADVNEAGAGGRAGAATVIVPVCLAPQEQAVGFLVDRPFLFLVRDRFTGAALFLGRVVDPR